VEAKLQQKCEAPGVTRVCFYHAGCPDGFGAAWAVRQAWGELGQYEPRGHDDEVPLAALSSHRGVHRRAPKHRSALGRIAERVVA
jgi:hypothetical protein